MKSESGARPGEVRERRTYFLNLKEPQLRTARYLLIAGLVGVLLLLTGNLLDQQQPDRSSQIDPGRFEGDQLSPSLPAGNTDADLEVLERALSLSVQKALSGIEGAGRVQVSVVLAGSPEYRYERNHSTTSKRTEEQDAGGGKRTIGETAEDSQLALHRSGGGDQPVIASFTRPAIRGVLVVAEGAVDSRVKARLNRAVQVMLDLPAHKVFVSAMEEGNIQ